MKKNIVILLSAFIFLFISQSVSAEVSGLVPCKDSPAFAKRLKQSLKKLEVRLSQYEPSTPPALAINNQIKQTQSRFDKYSKAGILCGSEGLPHLIADGRWSHAGDFMLPGLLFIYITGWIGWVGRSYLRAVSLLNKPSEKEIIIDVPLAMKFSLSGFTWPLAALQEFTSGQLLASDDDISISPR
uniref:photosystem I reaction center subunit III n=1 Tax=Xiphosiphonia pinnulata TaxID=2305477 RepID=UPI0022FD5E3E|nr:photosystem I reaction center subunit III [Xiphosiphonia pinnulata]WAX03392.1 photosystem I reaction center subunit III [Xiphosiphonia pinnulata]